MLPGNLQYWQPCRWLRGKYSIETCGTKFIKINEPIHIDGPSPGDQTTIAEAEEEDQTQKFEPDLPVMTDKDDSHGAAQQLPPEETTTPVQRPTKEELKEPEPSQTVEPVEPVDIAVMSDPSDDPVPRVNQQLIETVQLSSEVNQATLRAFQSILAQ